MSKLKSKLYPDIFKDWKMHELSEWKTLLLSRLKEKLEQKDKMFTMLQLSEVERSIGNRKEAASWLDKCFPYYSKYGQAEHKGMLFFIKGHLLMLSGLYDESLVSALNGLRYFMQTDNHEYIARSHRLCANICGWLGLFEESMEYHEKSIAEALITGESDFVGDCMLRQNETKMSLLKSVSVVGDFLETIAYMQQVKKGGDSHTEADALTVLCSLYIYADDLDSAKKSLGKVQRNETTSGHYRQSCDLYCNGRRYLRKRGR